MGSFGEGIKTGFFVLLLLRQVLQAECFARFDRCVRERKRRLLYETRALVVLNARTYE